MTLASRYGQFDVPAEDDLIVTSLHKYGEWAQLELDILAGFIGKNDTVVDAGAFIGTHSRAFSAMVGRNGKVHAFEPNPSIFPFLAKNAALAQYSNIISYPFALGAIEESRLLISGLAGHNQGASKLTPCDRETTADLLEVKPLDCLDITTVDFIKADVEGMERLLLTGAEETIKRSRPAIFLEVNSVEASFGILEWARHLKYLNYGLINPAFNPRNFNRESVNIFHDAKECGLLLLHEDKMNERFQYIEHLGLPEVKTTDDLVLLLLHKPQYPHEVLAKTSVAMKLGINYPAPSFKNVKKRNLGQAILDALPLPSFLRGDREFRKKRP